MEAHTETIIKERLKSFASEKTQTQSALAYMVYMGLVNSQLRLLHF